MASRSFRRSSDWKRLRPCRDANPGRGQVCARLETGQALLLSVLDLRRGRPHAGEKRAR